MIVDADGGVTLGYNGLATFVTTSTGATLTGDLLSDSNNTRSIGSSTNKYANVHATTFTGALTGNVTEQYPVLQTMILMHYLKDLPIYTIQMRELMIELMLL